MEILQALPLHVRLFRYKQIKKEIEEFVEWEQRHYQKLMESWYNYVHTVKLIGYREFCIQFFTGTLEEVTKNSYFKTFK